ncbi:hypothetical protein NDU88_001688 [Pleurodeles waltl]|uniref:Uncharacterized protein n=1 Tax=Pleurodeles waltl TaxID=8319 RepID=A0AAV7WMQ0_PLEWA|nr:hypothetical protein NDU88_001688 [Pleurodeles waltl]
MTESAQPEERFSNPNTTPTGERQILQMPLAATRPLQRRRNKKMPEPGRQRRQRREDFPDAQWDEQEVTKCTDRPRSGKSMA